MASTYTAYKGVLKDTLSYQREGAEWCMTFFMA